MLSTDLTTKGLDFLPDFKRVQPDFLVVTTDDKYGDIKRKLCADASWGCQYVVLEKTPPVVTPPVSTTSILSGIRAPRQCPLRVDF